MSNLNSVHEGLGLVNWWGFTPALDLISHAQRCAETAAGADAAGGAASAPAAADDAGGSDGSEVNILLMGAGDIRHILRTVAVLRRSGSTRPVHFWISERGMELIARQMLQLALAYAPPERLGLQQKAEMFLELLGNSHVRSQTSEFLIATSARLIELVTDPELMEKHYPLVSLKPLKFSERDDLEEVFKFWRQPSPKNFVMSELWDFRLREYLKQRYDSRSNLADWDYSMKLKDYSPIVHVRHFCRWREDGIAFDIRDAPYDVPNRTLASGRVFREKRGGVEKRGYWGDIVNSPYIGLGVECEDQSFFKLRQDKFMKSSVDVAMYNMSAHIHEALTGTVYTPPRAEDDEPSSAEASESKITEVEEESAAAAPVQSPPAGAVVPDGDMTAPLPNVRITMLPEKFPSEMGSKSKYRGLFDVAYFGGGMVQHLKEEGATAAFKPSATIVLEGVLHYLGLTNEQKAQFGTKVSEFATNCGAVPIGKIDGTKDSYYSFKMPPAPAE